MHKVAQTISILLIVAFVGILLIISISANSSETKVIKKTPIKEAIIIDATTRFPNADKIDLINLDIKDGNEVFVLKVTYNYSSICPTRYHVYYTYPDGKFLPEYPVKVTNCNFCDTSPCKIIYEEEAIIASVNLPKLKYIRNFVSTTKANVHVNKYFNFWEVKWIANNEVYDINISNKGEVLNESFNQINQQPI